MNIKKILIFLIFLVFVIYCDGNDGSERYKNLNKKYQTFLYENLSLNDINSINKPDSIEIIVDTTNSMLGFASNFSFESFLTELDTYLTKLSNDLNIDIDYYRLGKKFDEEEDDIDEDLDSEYKKPESELKAVDKISDFYTDKRIYRSIKVNFYNKINERLKSNTKSKIVLFITDAQFDNSSSYSGTSLFNNIIKVSACKAPFHGTIDYVPVGYWGDDRNSEVYKADKPLFIFIFANEAYINFFDKYLNHYTNSNIGGLDFQYNINFYNLLRDTLKSNIKIYKKPFVVHEYVKLDEIFKFDLYDNITEYLYIKDKNLLKLEMDLAIKDKKFQKIPQHDITITIDTYKSKMDNNQRIFWEKDNNTITKAKPIVIKEFIFDKLNIKENDQSELELNNLDVFSIDYVGDFLTIDKDVREVFKNKDKTGIENFDYKGYSKDLKIYNIILKEIDTDNDMILKISTIKEKSLPVWVNSLSCSVDFGTEESIQRSKQAQKTKVWNLSQFIEHIMYEKKIISNNFIYLDTQDSLLNQNSESDNN